MTQKALHYLRSFSRSWNSVKSKTTFGPSSRPAYLSSKPSSRLTVLLALARTGAESAYSDLQMLPLVSGLLNFKAFLL